MLYSSSWALPTALLLGSVQNVLAQTSSSCNPTTNTSCPVDPALATTHEWYFNTTDAPSSDLWTVTAGTVDWNTDGANFTISAKGDSPTIRSNFYIFGGRVELHMKAAPGTGIISSFMMLSDDLDEIDWEFLGGNGTAVQTNYFGKGVNNYTWQNDFEVTGGTLADFHNYTVDWTNETLKWYIDGELKRTLTPAEANNTHSYPQTPMRVYVGPWAGGDPDNAEGTIAWAGGETDYNDGPFTMAVKSIKVTDYGRGTAYNYTDQSGKWDSIAMLNTEKNSTAADTIASNSDSDSESISEKFNALPTGAKAAIAACSAAAGLGLVAYSIFYCYRQRKRGAAEAAAATKAMENERVELEGYKARGINPDGFAEVQPEYDAATGMGTVTRNVPVGGEYGMGNEKFGATGMGMGMAAGAATRPLLSRDGGSPPGTPHGDVPHDPYSDGFSAINNNGFGHVDHPQSPHGMPGMPPNGPLPGVPNRSFSNPGAAMHQGGGGYGGDGQPARSFTNPNAGQHGGYWRQDGGF